MIENAIVVHSTSEIIEHAKKHVCEQCKTSDFKSVRHKPIVEGDKRYWVMSFRCENDHDCKDLVFQIPWVSEKS